MTKKRIAFSVFALLALIVAGIVAIAVSGRSRSVAVQEESKAFPCVRTVTVYAALAEHPCAKTVMLVGPKSKDYRAIFERAGLSCASGGKARCDIVFAAGADGEAVASAFGRNLATNGILAVCIDARGLEAPRLWKLLSEFPAGDFRFWMPGESDWLAVGRRGEASPALDSMLELFVREGSQVDLAESKCDSLPTLFAAYVGAKGDVMPAFNGSLALVRAENFVTRETPSLDWIDASRVDADIAKAALSRMRMAQIVRRMVLAGNLYAARGDEKRSAETWARAATRSPGDSLLVERLERLSVNGKVFLQLGKAAMAARCYETMAQILPDDPEPVRNYGTCLEKLGKKDVAVRAFARARVLENKKKRSVE